MRHRHATPADAAVLGELNHQLIRDEGHRNAMTPPELAERMRGWLEGEYRAALFEDEAGIAAYALYRVEADHVHLRQFFVQRDRRSAGVGRACLRTLVAEVWPPGMRVSVEVLCANPRAAAFYRAYGFRDYSLALELFPE